MRTQKTFLALAFIISSLSFGQTNTFPTTGNVGIGTVNPTTNLHVEKWSPGVVDLLRLRNNYASSSALHGVSILLDGYYSQSKISSFEDPQHTLGGNLQFQTYNNAGILNTGILLDRFGNVGIGTKTPITKLDVAGDIRFSSTLSTDGRMHITGGERLYVLNKDGLILGKEWGGSGNLSVQGNTTIDGNVGIGTATPSANLEISKLNSNLMFDVNTNSLCKIVSRGWNANMDIHTFKIDGTENINQLILNTNGNVGIGTKNPDEMLTVKGKIHAEEIIVTAGITPDYVFQKYYTGKSALKSDYVMPTLAEIESYTKKNNHLPNVPSAQEIQQKGLSLGEMSNVLLQKVEELTLYAIEQQKEIERLKTENEQYKSLAERLATIENLLKK